MNQSDFHLFGKYDQSIYVSKWIPEDKAPRAVIQLAHGMAEHITRYNDFAEKLVGAGYAVYGNDHRGHGKTAGSLENIGYFADEDGFNVVVEDMKLLTDTINEEHPKLPVFLFGHSMGSLLSRSYIARFGDGLKGVVLSGTTASTGLLGLVAVLLAKIECKIKGRKVPSKFLDSMVFGAFNKPYKPARTDFDWLSRDNEQVDLYVNDPYCGGVFTAGFFLDFFSGLSEMFKTQNTKKIPKELPMYIFSGELDPVGGKKGTMVKKTFEIYKNAGIKDIEIKLYPEARHEMLNEINKEDVYNDVIQWFNKKLG